MYLLLWIHKKKPCKISIFLQLMCRILRKLLIFILKFYQFPLLFFLLFFILFSRFICIWNATNLLLCLQSEVYSSQHFQRCLKRLPQCDNPSIFILFYYTCTIEDKWNKASLRRWLKICCWQHFAAIHVRVKEEKKPK